MIGRKEAERMQAGIDRALTLTDEWEKLPCVCGYRIPNGNDDSSQCLSCAAFDLRTALDVEVAK